MTASGIPRAPVGCPPIVWLTVIKTLQFYDNQGIVWKNKDTGEVRGLRPLDVVYTRRDGDIARVKLQFDMERLPPGISKQDILKPEVLETLPYVVHGDVYIEDRHGLALIVDFERSRSRETRLPALVKFRVAYADSIMHQRGTWIPLGMGASGPEWYRLEDLEHILVTGITQSGKSTWIQTLIAWLTTRYRPQEVQLVLLDAKNRTHAEELGVWDGAAHLWCPVAHEPRIILETIKRLRAAIETRGAAFGDHRGYDRYVAHTGQPLSRIVVIFDEFMALKDTMNTSDFAEVTAQLGWYARTVRSKGVHMICCTQDVKTRALDKSITDQFDYRVSFRLPDSQVAARLKVQGAETIPQNARGRLITNIGGALHLLQGFLVDDRYLEARAAAARARAIPLGPQRQLTDDELRMCLVARNMLAANFNVGEMYQLIGPKKCGGMSQRRIENTAKTWGERGWLVAVGGKNGQGWVMTQKLLEIVASDEQIKEGEGK